LVDDGKAEDARRQAEQLFEQLKTPEQILDTLEKAERQTYDPHELRRAAVRALGRKTLEKQTGHMLDDFAPLLEDNPRAMKKLLITYGLERDIMVLEGRAALDDGQLLRQNWLCGRVSAAAGAA
jgi:HEAT repeat protein